VAVTCLAEVDRVEERDAYPAGAMSDVAADAVTVSVEVEVVITEHLDLSGVARTIAAPAGAVVVVGVGVEAAAVVRIAIPT
jgi:hypothetical protein